MKSDWVIHTNAKNEKNATVLFNRFAKQIGGEIDSFQCIPHGGSSFNVRWSMHHKSTSWSDFVLEVLQLAQNVGNGWLLTGDVMCQCDAWCNRPKVAGVQIIEWSIEKTGFGYGEGL